MRPSGHAALSGVGVAGVSAVLPAGEIAFVEEMCGMGVPLPEAEKAARLSGLAHRRIAPPGVTALDLCVRAAEELLDALSPQRPVPDAILFASLSPDYPLPASASIAQGRLAVKRSCLCLDVSGGCTAYVNGLLAGMSLVAGGGIGSVLLLVGDVQGRFLHPENRVTAPLFGDAGTATLIEGRGSASVASFSWGVDGARWETLAIPGGGSRIPPIEGEDVASPFNAVVRDSKGNPWTLGGHGQLWMDGIAVLGFGTTVVPKHIREHCALAGVRPESLDRLLLHQANRMMTETIARKAGIPLERVPMGTLRRYGNLGGASVPVMLCDEFAAQGTPQGKVMLCGFGTGLSWASCILSLEAAACLPLVTDDGRGTSREEAASHWKGKFRGAR